MTKFNKETATVPRPTHTHGQTKGVKQIKRQTEGEPRDTCTGGVYGQLYRRASEESMILKALHGVTVTSAVASLPSQSTQPTCCCWRRVLTAVLRGAGTAFLGCVSAYPSFVQFCLLLGSTIRALHGSAETSCNVYL